MLQDLEEVALRNVADHAQAGFVLPFENLVTAEEVGDLVRQIILGQRHQFGHVASHHDDWALCDSRRFMHPRSHPLAGAALALGITGSAGALAFDRPVRASAIDEQIGPPRDAGISGTNSTFVQPRFL
jgi:hypothetical protein